MDPAELQSIYEKEDNLKAAIIFAREYLKTTKVSSEQIRYLCEEASRGGTDGWMNR
jgi:magnesium chelatase subunit D